MRLGKIWTTACGNRRVAVLSLTVSLTALIGSGFVSAALTQESRPRRSEAMAPSNPAQTPSPAPRQTVSQPATSATPLPAPTQTPVDRIAPHLGEPPPPPILKPKPTPPPSDEDFDEGSTLRINTELVTLNVRVIDRNNRPIDNVRQSDFHVFEDGVPQPIESFTREEVPINYGLAIDTSGSLRSQLQAVIDAGKSIINSNKPGDETFLVRFISSDKIETVQDFTPSKTC